MGVGKNGIVSGGYIGAGNSSQILKPFNLNPNMVDTTSWGSYNAYWMLQEVTDTSIFLKKNTSESPSVIALFNGTCLHNYVIGDTYTISMYIFRNGAPYNAGDRVISTFPSYIGSRVSWCTRDDGFYSETFVVKANSSGGKDEWMIHNDLAGTCTDGTLVELRYIKVEKGSRPTPWCPHSSSPNYLSIDNKSYGSGLIATDFIEV